MATVESVQGEKRVEESHESSDCMWPPLSEMCRKNGFGGSYLCKEKSCNSIDSKLTKYSCIVKINGLKNLTNSTKQTKPLSDSIHLRPRDRQKSPAGQQVTAIRSCKRKSHNLRDIPQAPQTGSLNNNNEDTSSARLSTSSPTADENMHTADIRTSGETRPVELRCQDIKHSGNNPSKVFHVKGSNNHVAGKLSNGHRLSLRRMGVHSLNHNGLSRVAMQNGCLLGRNDASPSPTPAPTPCAPPEPLSKAAKVPLSPVQADATDSTAPSSGGGGGSPRVFPGRVTVSSCPCPGPVPKAPCPTPPLPGPTPPPPASPLCSPTVYKLCRSSSSSFLPVTSQAPSGLFHRTQSSSSSLFLLTQENSCSSTSSLVSFTSQDVGGGTSADAPKLSTCRWDNCGLECAPSQLKDHLLENHVQSQTGESFVCLWNGCKVYNKASSSRKWLDRHIVSHSGDKPFPCIVDGCGQQFKSQYSLERHVNSHFNTSRPGSKFAARSKEDTPSKHSKKKKAKRKRTLPARTHDFFDPRIMEGVQQHIVHLSQRTNMDISTAGNHITFHSTVIARRTDASGLVQVLQHWSPENILSDSWVPESRAKKTQAQVVSASELPHDSLVQLDASFYSPHRYRKHRRK